MPRVELFEPFSGRVFKYYLRTNEILYLIESDFKDWSSYVTYIHRLYYLIGKR
jgi:hypothetical protein